MSDHMTPEEMQAMDDDLSRLTGTLLRRMRALAAESEALAPILSLEDEALGTSLLFCAKRIERVAERMEQEE
jgi:hypothetical protein